MPEENLCHSGEPGLVFFKSQVTLKVDSHPPLGASLVVAQVGKREGQEGPLGWLQGGCCGMGTWILHSVGEGSDWQRLSAAL